MQLYHDPEFPMLRSMEERRLAPEREQWLRTSFWSRDLFNRSERRKISLYPTIWIHWILGITFIHKTSASKALTCVAISLLDRRAFAHQYVDGGLSNSRRSLKDSRCRSARHQSGGGHLRSPKASSSLIQPWMSASREVDNPFAKQSLFQTRRKSYTPSSFKQFPAMQSLQFCSCRREQFEKVNSHLWVVEGTVCGEHRTFVARDRNHCKTWRSFYAMASAEWYRGTMAHKIPRFRLVGGRLGSWPSGKRIDVPRQGFLTTKNRDPCMWLTSLEKSWEESRT